MSMFSAAMPSQPEISNRAQIVFSAVWFAAAPNAIFREKSKCFFRSEDVSVFLEVEIYGATLMASPPKGV
ncbi:hypothetical protein RRG08_044620 [Elysia crispata]|uniref:Uncharacterized protein n=1 Tax=Elysia crispata TaxID=231223 RepID=A0AAE0YMK3_9GAST|nr:hypothetical protein RRG08_044620 [Elysia crispata]